MQKEQLNVEVVEYNETEGYVLVKLPANRLECGINLTPTLFPVRTPLGDLYDEEVIKSCTTEPTRQGTPLRQKDVRPDKFCAEISMALFKKKPHLFELGGKFQILFTQALKDNDVDLAKSLIANAFFYQMKIDATELLLVAYERKRAEIFAVVLVEFMQENYSFDRARICTYLTNALRAKKYEWLFAVFNYLIEKKISNANYLNITGIVDVAARSTPLYWACDANLLWVARNLLQCDTSHVNTLSGIRGEDTPLCAAARNGNEELMKAMIEKNADINLPGLYKQTPFMTAITASQNALLTFFAQKKAGLNWIAFDDVQNSIMNIACREENVVGLRFLLDNAPRQQQKFLLRYAPKHHTLLGMAIKADEDCALLLIERGVGLFSLSRGKTPLAIAQAVECINVQQALENYYSNHINEMLLQLLNPNHDTETLMNEWLAHKQALYDNLSGYTTTLLQGDHSATELKVVRSAINGSDEEKSVLQKYFELLPSFLDRFRNNPWPGMLQALGKTIEDELLMSNQTPALPVPY